MKCLTRAGRKLWNWYQFKPTRQFNFIRLPIGNKPQGIRKSKRVSQADAERERKAEARDRALRRRYACHSRKQYAIALHRLISGVNRLESEEQLRTTLEGQISQIVADDDYDDLSQVDHLVSQHDAADWQVTEELIEMSKRVDWLLVSIDEQRESHPLPRHFTSQLWRYEQAREACLKHRRLCGNDEERLRVIEGTLFQNENRTGWRGWIPTSSKFVLCIENTGLHVADNFPLASPCAEPARLEEDDFDATQGECCL